jgi:hypothetical protein
MRPAPACSIGAERPKNRKRRKHKPAPEKSPSKPIFSPIHPKFTHLGFLEEIKMLQKVRKTTDFTRKSVVLLVAGAGFEPTAFGL